MSEDIDMDVIHLNKWGWLLGALMVGWHSVWSLLVAIGWAQPIIDFIK
jgi:hypothetical protein